MKNQLPGAKTLLLINDYYEVIKEEGWRTESKKYGNKNVGVTNSNIIRYPNIYFRT